MIFANGPEVQEPLRLSFGDPTAGEPGFDLARTLPINLPVIPSQVTLGPVTENPEYRPPPKPWTERWPGLFYVALGSAGVVLLGLLGLIARQALARHDQTHPGPVEARS